MEGATTEAQLGVASEPTIPTSDQLALKDLNEEENDSSSSSSEDDDVQDDVHAIGFMVDPNPSQNIIQQMSNQTVEALKPKRVIIETQDLSSSDSSDEDVPQELEDIESDEEKPGAWSVPKSKNELVSIPPPPPVTIQISEQDKLTRIGTVSHTIEDMAVIQADMNSTALDIESLLAFEDRTPIGKVEEVFGPVPQPFYTVRFLSGLDPSRFEKGTIVCAVESHTSFVLPSQIYVKGSDASNEYDEEIPPELQEFSDDEEEQKARQMRKYNKKCRQAPGAAQLSTHEYEPLARPKDVMAAYASQISTGNQHQPYSHPQKKQRSQYQPPSQPSFPQPHQQQQFMVPPQSYQHPPTYFTHHGYGYPLQPVYPPQYSQPMYSQPAYAPQVNFAQSQTAFDLFSAPPLITAPSYLPTDFNTTNPIGMLGRGKGFRTLSQSQELQQQQQQQQATKQQYPSNGPSAPSTTPVNFADLEQLKVVDLRNELKKRNLDTSGLRTQLLARLKDNWNVPANQ